jgi:hypothetical protein
LKQKLLSTILIILIATKFLAAQESIAQLWTKHVLFAVTNDFARPTIHARNLFHSSIVMYDAWAAYESSPEFYLLNQQHPSLFIPFEGVVIPEDKIEAQEKAICFAMFRLMTHRFIASPGAVNTIPRINAFMDSLNYDRFNTSIDYINGGPAEFGNYLAAKMIEFAYLDGSNEINNYANEYYTPMQNAIEPEFPGNPNMLDPNRWQAIALSFSVDQAGNILTSNPPFLSPEWGNVTSFAIPPSAQTAVTRDGDQYLVHHDPGPPVYLDTSIQTQLDSYYKWNFTLVSVWQSHLDPNDTTVWDISPASIGNIQNYPTQFSDYPAFYNYFDGGDPGAGYTINPATNLPYMPQLVKRADYARVLAEFWADGLDSETPPGHWFKIYNQISKHPLYEKKWRGLGSELDDLEYDVKLYLTMGGAMHDAAISAWSVKGWYDYARPVSAIRFLADKGQSTSDTLANYHKAGIPLLPNYIELVKIGDPLAGLTNQHVGKIKLFTWKGPDYIADPESTYAGVGWILAENWWPYQRPSFVTPPFAGYVSGHSTFSRAAAEVLAYATGDPFFPGGMSDFVALENEFLEFEEGPSTDINLQWAKYKDASDQCSLSRIWGGIHPPTDDINGRLMGEIVGLEAAGKANTLFEEVKPKIDSIVSNIDAVNIQSIGQNIKVKIYYGQVMDVNVNPKFDLIGANNPLNNSLSYIGESWINNKIYELSYQITSFPETMSTILAQVDSGINMMGALQKSYVALNPFLIDKVRPSVQTVIPAILVVNDSISNLSTFYIDVLYDEVCDTASIPVLSFSNPTVAVNILTLNTNQSSWINSTTYRFVYNVVDTNTEIPDIGVLVSGGLDALQNLQNISNSLNVFDIITTNPSLLIYTINDSILSRADIGGSALICTFQFNQNLETAVLPNIVFSDLNLLNTSLVLNAQNSFWIDSFNLQMTYDLENLDYESGWIDIDLAQIIDANGNPIDNALIQETLLIDTEKPEIIGLLPSAAVISDNEFGPLNFNIKIYFDEKMNQQQKPIAELFLNGTLNSEVNYNVFGSDWISDSIFEARFNVLDNNIELDSFELRINFAQDAYFNAQNLRSEVSWIALDTKNPSIISFTANTYELTNQTTQLKFTSIFDEKMDLSSNLLLAFPNASGIDNVLTQNMTASQWLNNWTYELVYDVQAFSYFQEYIQIQPIDAKDLAQNKLVELNLDSFLRVNINPLAIRDLNTPNLVYPNPVQSGALLFLDLGFNVNQGKVGLFNEIGMLIREYDLNQWSGALITLEIPKHISGIHLIRIETKETVLTTKVLISP